MASRAEFAARREQHAAAAQDMFAKGMSRTTIALQLDLSTTYVSDLLADPDGSKRRLRKDGYPKDAPTRNVALADVPLEERADAAAVALRECRTESERWMVLAAVLCPSAAMHRVVDV